MCLSGDTCSGNTKLASGGDGFTCVETCASGKYEENSENGEPRCVNDCAHWWYRAEDNGLCKEQKWRRDTAIAVPIAAVALILVIIAAVCACRKRASAAQAEGVAMSAAVETGEKRDEHGKDEVV